MPYSDAQRYADIYRTQESYQAADEKIVEDEAALLGLFAKFNLSESKKITNEEASALAERYGLWRAHLLFSDLLARLNRQNYEAFLHNKPALTEMHEAFE